MARGRLLRRRVPARGARCQFVRADRGQPLHHSWPAAVAVARRASRPWVDAVMTAMPFAEVIGDPIEHSRSPEIHAFWLEQAGIAAEYRRRRVAKDGLESYLAEVRGDPAWRGCNVTMPLKMEAVLAADQPRDRKS